MERFGALQKLHSAPLRFEIAPLRTAPLRSDPGAQRSAPLRAPRPERCAPLSGALRFIYIYIYIYIYINTYIYIYIYIYMTWFIYICIYLYIYIYIYYFFQKYVFDLLYTIYLYEGIISRFRAEFTTRCKFTKRVSRGYQTVKTGSWYRKRIHNLL